MTSVTLLDRLAVRETIEDYLDCLDRRDWDGLAACFTDDARSTYNLEPDVMIGGDRLALFLRLVEAYASTNHALSYARVDAAGDLARCESRVLATLHLGEHATGRIQVRSIQYQDRLRRVGDRWVICERVHTPLWQFDVTSVARQLV